MKQAELTKNHEKQKQTSNKKHVREKDKTWNHESKNSMYNDPIS